MSVTDEQAHILADGDYEPVVQIGIGTTINMAHLASDLLDARAALRAVCEAGEATIKTANEVESGDGLITSRWMLALKSGELEAALAAARKQMGEK